VGKVGFFARRCCRRPPTCLTPATPQRVAWPPCTKSVDENDDWCASCLQPGDLLCCDTCPKSFHYLCAEPPLDATPEGDWRCTECRTRVRARSLGTRTVQRAGLTLATSTMCARLTQQKSPPPPPAVDLSKAKTKSILAPFLQLATQLDRANPVTFSLPHVVQQRFGNGAPRTTSTELSHGRLNIVSTLHGEGAHGAVAPDGRSGQFVDMDTKAGRLACVLMPGLVRGSLAEADWSWARGVVSFSLAFPAMGSSWRTAHARVSFGR